MRRQAERRFQEEDEKRFRGETFFFILLKEDNSILKEDNSI